MHCVPTLNNCSHGNLSIDDWHNSLNPNGLNLDSPLAIPLLCWWQTFLQIVKMFIISKSNVCQHTVRLPACCCSEEGFGTLPRSATAYRVLSLSLHVRWILHPGISISFLNKNGNFLRWVLICFARHHNSLKFFGSKNLRKAEPTSPSSEVLLSTAQVVGHPLSDPWLELVSQLT